MLKKLTALLLALLLPAAALAEVYEGTTAAMDTVTVRSEVAGTVKTLDATAGQRVSAGETLLTLSPTKAFAAQDGAVSLVEVKEGEDADGTVLEIAPVERYQVYCTVSKAYQSAASTLIHSGETVYIRCTSDGSHRAVGVVTLVDGEEYRVLTLGGALYVGETVYLYRDADFTLSERVGIGTVVANDTEVYEAKGALTRLCVQAGDVVERGQLLYELDGGSVEAPVSGILTAVNVKLGDSVAEDQAAFEIVPDGALCVEISVEETEAAAIRPGERAELTPALGDGAIILSGTVVDVSRVAADGAYTVRVLPDDGCDLPLGMSVTVRL